MRASVDKSPVQIKKDPLCGCAYDDAVWRTSTSGGAFSCICNLWADRRPIIFGARFDGVEHVLHDWGAGAEASRCFRGSKYVQSEIGNAYRRCREFLQDGQYVIFSGAPCQIAGLRSFLGGTFEKLLTIEFICHGVGSPLVFSDMLRRTGEKFKSQVIHYAFRSKLKWPQRNIYASECFLADGRKMVAGDEYCAFFLNQLCVRKSCGSCRFKNENRYADITLGDARGEDRIYPDKGDKNWSVIVANTLQGESVVARLNMLMRLEKYPIEMLRRHNPSYFQAKGGNAKREEFFRRFLRGDKTDSLLRLCAGTPFSRIMMSFKRYASLLLRKFQRLIVEKGGLYAC